MNSKKRSQQKTRSSIKINETKNSLINNYSFLNGGKYFGENGSQNYLLFWPFSRYFVSKNGKICSWLLHYPF